jgi:hypothetical protein
MRTVGGSGLTLQEGLLSSFAHLRLFEPASVIGIHPPGVAVRGRAVRLQEARRS